MCVFADRGPSKENENILRQSNAISSEVSRAVFISYNQQLQASLVLLILYTLQCNDASNKTALVNFNISLCL